MSGSSRSRGNWKLRNFLELVLISALVVLAILCVDLGAGIFFDYMSRG